MSGPQASQEIKGKGEKGNINKGFLRRWKRDCSWCMWCSSAPGFHPAGGNTRDTKNCSMSMNMSTHGQFSIHSQ